MNKKIGLILIFISALLLPGMQVLFIIGCNSKFLLVYPLFVTVCILNVLLIITLLVGIVLFIRNRKYRKRKMKKWLKI